jgi:hypothetical protein
MTDAAALDGRRSVGNRTSLSVPRTLPPGPDGRPLRHLSKSSLELFKKCPEAWKRRYLDGVREPGSVAMAAGSALSSALAAYFQGAIDGHRPSPGEVDDRLVWALARELERAEPREGEDAGHAREGARDALRAYLDDVAPSVRPLATERRAEVRFPAAEWSLVAYLDLETEDAAVVDYKLAKPGGQHVSAQRAANDLQKRLYLLCRLREGAPAERFEWHSGLSHEPSSGERWRVIEGRASEHELRNFEAEVAQLARRIVRCAETGDWGYSAPAWWCAEPTCVHWPSCPGGGLR